MRIDRGQTLRTTAIFVGIVAVGGWPWPGVTLGFSGAYCSLVDSLLLDHMTFGHGGHARLSPRDELVRGAGDAVTADATLSLSVDGFEGDVALGVSLRRDACLPLLVVSAAALAAPGAPRRRGQRLVVGFAVVLAYTIAALCLVVLWTFVVRMRDVYAVSDLSRATVDLAHRMVLVPPANRFIVPLAVGVALGFWGRSAPRSGVSSTPDASAKEH